MTTQPDAPRARLLAVIAFILTVAALRASRPVTLPLAASVFLVVLMWPMQLRLESRLPRPVALLATLAVVLLATGAISWSAVWTVARLVDRAPQLAERLGQLADDTARWMIANKLPLPDALTAQPQRAVAEWVGPMLGAAARRTYSAAATLALALTLAILGLLEVRAFEARVSRRLPPQVGRAVLNTAAAIAGQTRRYLLALSLSSGISGVLTTVYAFAVGLELALMWGLVTWLLNYVPTLGPILSVLPPTLYAFVQFDGLARPAAVFAGLGAIQFVMGNVVDPRIEGRVLSLSPLVVLVSVILWGWVWGALGALLSVPLTAALVITCRQFPNIQWIAALVSNDDDGDEATNTTRSA